MFLYLFVTVAAGGWVQCGRRKGSEGWVEAQERCSFYRKLRQRAVAGKAWLRFVRRMQDGCGGGQVGTVCSSNIRYGTYRIVPRCIDINDTVKACCSLWIDRNVGVTGRKGGVGRRGRRRRRKKARAGFVRSLCIYYVCVCGCFMV